MDISTHALNMYQACIREAATNTLLHKEPSYRLMQNHKFTWLHLCAVKELNRIRRTMGLSMHLKGPNSSTDTYVYHGKKFTILTSETPDTEEYCIEVGDEGVPVKFPATVTYMEYNYRKYFESQVDLMARYRCIDCKSINCNKELEHWKWDFVNKIKRENEVPHGNMGQWYQTGEHDIDECDEKTMSACLGEQLIMYPLLEFSHIRIFNYYRSVMRSMMRTVMMNH